MEFLMFGITAFMELLLLFLSIEIDGISLLDFIPFVILIALFFKFLKSNNSDGS